MKLLQQPERSAGEFEGRTSDEAVRLARQELGLDVPVRCWKTRRGGVFGFFAKEAFVAGVAPPRGAIKRVKTPRPAQPREEPEETPTDLTAPRAPSVQLLEHTSLSDLVEGTTDKVTLGSALVTESSFGDILKEAQAALSGVDEPAACERPVSPTGPGPARPERIEGLRATLAEIGVPVQYWPHGSDVTLDGLARAIDRLPRAEPVTARAGSVIVVVGARRDAHAAAERVLANLGLESSELVVAERTSSGRQRVARRRSSMKATVLVVDGALRSRDLGEVATWIEKLNPDYVLGAVSATEKCSDVKHWRSQLGRIDALALSRASDTTTPGELIGEMPIAFIDGSSATTLRWVMLILNAVVERGQ